MSTHSGRVVVAVDGTHSSAGAISYAVEEARARGAGLTAVHVTPSYTPMAPMLPMVPMVDTMPALIEAESRKLLSSVTAGIAAQAPDLDVEGSLLRGPRSSAIVQAAATAALLVVGREGRTGLDRLATGATTVKVAARAHCPVAVVPADWQPGTAKHRIVVGVRSTSQSDGLIGQAFEMAVARHDSLLVVHAWRLPDPYVDWIEERTNVDEWLAEGEQLLEGVLAEWRHACPGVGVETKVVHDGPVAALVSAGRGADLLLLPRRSYGPIHLGRLGATTRAILLHATIPVMVLPIPHTALLGMELEASRRPLR